MDLVIRLRERSTRHALTTPAERRPACGPTEYWALHPLLESAEVEEVVTGVGAPTELPPGWNT